LKYLSLCQTPKTIDLVVGPSKLDSQLDEKYGSGRGDNQIQSYGPSTKYRATIILPGDVPICKIYVREKHE
jgi:hypothetical protein